MAKAKPQSIKFKYVFPADLKDLYINGVYGGITFGNKIAMHLFSERGPIPKEETYELKSDGNLGERIEVKAGGDVIRLIQCSVTMEPTTARALITWLQEKLDILSKLTPEQKAEKH